MSPRIPPLQRALTVDAQALFWLAALPMLAAVWFPWVMLRPNRLAEGEFAGLPVGEQLLGGILTLAFPLAARWWPQVLAVLAAAALMVGLWWLGAHTAGALSGQGESARASASSGFWLWLLGSVAAVYGAGVSIRQQGARTFPFTLLARWLWLPLALFVLLSGHLASWSVMQEWQAQRERFGAELTQHVRLVGLALGSALLLGVPLAVWSTRRERVGAAALALASGIQTVPSLALLGLLIAPLAWLADQVPLLRRWGISGIGTAPALVAMTLYALLPVVRGGVLALRGIAPGILDAATGMGMTPGQRFWRTELPLSLPMWLSGVRQAAVLLVGVASVAQLIGAGGLGYFIFSGLQSGAADLILLGAIPAALLALLLEGALRLAETGLARWLGGAGESGGQHHVH